MDDEYSLVSKRQETVHVPLPPSYIGSRSRGVRELLDSWKGQYVQRLHGVLLRYEKVRFQDRSSAIIDDQPYVHNDVVADFYVFTPEVGSIVRGRINRITKSHLGCLIHDSINASILLPPNPNEELVPYLHVGQEILCKVQSVAMHKNSTLRLRAVITKECIQLMLETIECTAPYVPSDLEMEEDEDGEGEVDTTLNLSEDITFNLGEDTTFNLGKDTTLNLGEDAEEAPTQSDTSIQEEPRKKKKKASKKKKRHREEEPYDSDATVDLGPLKQEDTVDFACNGMEDDEVHTHKHKKKKKKMKKEKKKIKKEKKSHKKKA